MYDIPDKTWTVGEYKFRLFTNHHISSYAGKPLYDFLINGERKGIRELYASLDEAMVAAVGERHTGPRGAGGSGVDTAAGWFMRMIGAPTTE
jgi:hypothetical protein